MITTYRELTINKYLEIREILQEDGGELNIQANIIACLAGMDVDDVLNLTLTKYNDLARKTAFLMKKPDLNGRIPNKLNINNRECVITTNVNKLTAAQYIDYQTLTAMKDQEKYISNVLACFIVPKGMKYGDGYDIDEIITWIGENMSIQDAMNICFFFRKKYLHSIRTTLISLELQMKMMKLKTKNPEVKEKMKELNKKLTEYRKLLQNAGDGLVW